MPPGIFHVLGALAVTLGVLGLALHLLHRLRRGVPPAGRGVLLRVLQRVPLGPRQGLAVVQVADRVLVVSLAEGGTRLLTELEGPARDQALAGDRGAATPRPVRAWWQPLLGRVALVAVLLAAPAAGRAQSADRPAAARRAAVAPTPAVVTGAPVASVARPGPARTPALAAPARGAAARMPSPAVAGPEPPRVELSIGQGRDSIHLSGAVGIVVLIGVLTLLPALFLLMTSFTRILIVLHFLRSALGTQTAPPNQLLVALAVLLTGVVMNPVIQDANRLAYQPYVHGQITQGQAYQEGLKPFREFMLANTREQDLTLFAELSRAADVASYEDLPVFTVVSAFVTSELRTAFQMGFVIYLPFVVIDIIVASVLMSLGMFMLPPSMISLPVKLLLFVLADGWTLVVQNLVASYR